MDGRRGGGHRRLPHLATWRAYSASCGRIQVLRLDDLSTACAAAAGSSAAGGPTRDPRRAGSRTKRRSDERRTGLKGGGALGVALRIVALVLLIVASALAAVARGAWSATDSSPTATETRAANTVWLSSGHDPQLTNDVGSTRLSAATAAGVGLVWSAQLDGAIIASPLVGPAIVGARATKVVIVETRGGSV